MTQELEKIAEQAGGMMLTDHTEAEVRDWLQMKRKRAGREFVDWVDGIDTFYSVNSMGLFNSPMIMSPNLTSLRHV